MSDNKFKDAVIALYQAKAEVDGLTKQIGLHIGDCVDAQAAKMDQFNQGKFVEPHLKEAYRFERDGFERYLANDSPEFYLEENCQHCLKAHHLIQERKIARQKLGRAKGWVTKLGKQAVKELA